MKYGWEFSNGLLVLIVTDDLPALLAFVETSSCGLKKKCVSKDVWVSKTVFSAPTYANALHARMTKKTEKDIKTLNVKH